MSTKTSIQSLINSNLADNSAILASEHREVENSLLNELYPTILTDDNTTTNVVTENSSVSGIDYDLIVIKQGRFVTIKMELINNTGSIIGGGTNDYVFTITNSEFLPSTLENKYMFGCDILSLQNVRFNFESNKLMISSAFGIDGVINFNLTYFTEN